MFVLPRRRKRKPKGPTLETCSSRFYRYLLRQKKLSPRTAHVYADDIRGLDWWLRHDLLSRMRDRDEIRFFEVEPRPQDITDARLRRYREALLEHDGPATLNRRLAAIRHFLRWADRKGLLREDAPGAPNRVRAARPRPRWIPPEHQQRLLDVVERAGRPVEVAAVRLLLQAGLLVEETAALRWVWVDLDQKTLEVRTPEPDDHFTHPLRRVVSLPDDLCQALGRIRPAAPSPRDAVLQGQRGALKRRGIQDMVRRHADTAGLQDVSAQTLRHTYCRNLVAAGLPLERVAELAGHENLQTTRQYRAGPANTSQNA